MAVEAVSVEDWGMKMVETMVVVGVVAPGGSGADWEGRVEEVMEEVEAVWEGVTVTVGAERGSVATMAGVAMEAGYITQTLQCPPNESYARRYSH